MSDRPNIVLLMSDQQKASATSIYGNGQVSTPFMDRMAREGIAFDQAYAASPICTPSRASMMTGVHPLVHQVTCHQNRAPWNLPQLPELTAAAGYYNIAAGHYESTRNLTRGWHDRVSTDDRGVIGDAIDLWYAAGRRDVGWSSGPIDCTVEQSADSLLTDRVELMLDTAGNAGAPFFLHVPYYLPHPPYFAPPPYDTMFDPESLPLPRQHGRLPNGRPRWQEQCLIECATAQATDLDIRRVVAVYYGMIALVDAQMRRVYEALGRRGMLDNTWIIITSDHGDFTGEKGLFNKGELLYECLLHVPLIIRPPDRVHTPRGIHVEGLVNLIDLFPTIANLAGASCPDYVQGFDLVRWIANGAEEALRDCAFAQAGDYHGSLKTTFPVGIPESGRRACLVQGARTRTLSFVRDADWGDEAYNLREDPLELDNLLNPGCPPPPPEVDELRRSVDAHEAECLELRDRLGVVPGYHGFDPQW